MIKPPEEGVLSIPPIKEWRQIALLNRNIMKTHWDKIIGARKELIPEYTEDELFIGSGHQTLIVHPGIIARNLILSQLDFKARKFFINLDYDSPPLISTPLPNLLGRPRIVVEILKTNSEQRILEYLSPPSREELDMFFKRVREHVDTLRNPSRSKLVEEAHKKAEEALKGVSNFSEWAVQFRHKFEGEKSYIDVFASRLSKTRAFKNFFNEILENYKEFFSITNEILREYREAHGIKTRAQPFPDLERKGEHYELPFWHIKGGRRLRLYYNGVDFVDENGDRVDNPDIRPRALTLSIFTRLFLFDLFIHGTGGAGYQPVADRMIERFYHLPPPRYAVFSLTIGLADKKELKRLKHRLEDIKKAPYKFAHEYPSIKELALERERLVNKIRAQKSPDRETIKILRSVEDKIRKKLSNEIETLEKRAEILEVLTYREYPFFLFDRNEILKNLTGNGHFKNN